MSTIAIRFETPPDGKKRAFIVVYLKDTDEEMVYSIKDPRGEHPFYMADGARHDLTAREKEELRKEIPGR